MLATAFAHGSSAGYQECAPDEYARHLVHALNLFGHHIDAAEYAEHTPYDLITGEADPAARGWSVTVTIGRNTATLRRTATETPWTDLSLILNGVVLPAEVSPAQPCSSQAHAYALIIDRNMTRRR